VIGYILLILTFSCTSILELSAGVTIATVPVSIESKSEQAAAKKPGEVKKTAVDKKALDDELAKMFQDPEFLAYLKQQKSQDFDLFQEQSVPKLSESAEDKPVFDFYEDYVKVFYPRAYVIRMNVFSFMGPKELVKSLSQLVDIFTFEPWFYFTNDPKKFKIGMYWEYVVDQLRIISDYFKKARIDLETKEIFLPSNIPGYYSVFGRARRRRTRNLFLYLKSHHRQEISDFYALSFDYIIKLFNEGILLKNLKIANKYMSDLEFVMGKLRGTTYEAEYHESLKTCKELVALLKHKLGIDDLAMMEEFFGDDPEAMQMAKESYELGYMAD